MVILLVLILRSAAGQHLYLTIPKPKSYLKMHGHQGSKQPERPVRQGPIRYLPGEYSQQAQAPSFKELYRPLIPWQFADRYHGWPGQMPMRRINYVFYIDLEALSSPSSLAPARVRRSRYDPEQ